jgi:8-oxo-dGTP pyrophosphatase MutT (NUDIX family)
MGWSLTVAAIIERDGRFLVVEEQDKSSPARVVNQPAGHVEDGESLIEAVIRESWEEAGVRFEPTHVTGFYPLKARNGKDYFRVCFAGRIADAARPTPQDPEIHACHWMTPEEIHAFGPRSSLVLECIQDYQRGTLAPLSLLKAIQDDREPAVR